MKYKPTINYIFLILLLLPNMACHIKSHNINSNIKDESYVKWIMKDHLTNTVIAEGENFISKEDVVEEIFTAEDNSHQEVIQWHKLSDDLHLGTSMVPTGELNDYSNMSIVIKRKDKTTNTWQYFKSSPDMGDDLRVDGYFDIGLDKENPEWKIVSLIFTSDYTIAIQDKKNRNNNVASFNESYDYRWSFMIEEGSILKLE